MKKQEIRNTVKNAVDNILLEGCTDVSVFGNPFEIKYLNKKENKDEIISEVTSQIDSILNSNGKFNNLKINKISHMLVPKKSFFDFRKCALIEIIDEIKYLSLALLIAPKVEKKRVSRKIAFSYRFKSNDNGRIFDKKYNYSTFKNEYKKISSMKKYNIIIDCDISNFYDRLNIHRLNSTLLSIKEIDEKIVSTIDELLLFWANRDSYGLPVGSNASRILAEAFLIEIDNYLLTNDIKFCRFVDDYRFFATDVADANKILSLFVEILNKHGLSINLAKTSMRDIKDYHNATSSGEKKSKEGIAEIIRGYSGLVPTKFRKLSDSEMIRLKLENEMELIDKLKNDTIVEAEDIIKCLKVIVAKSRYDCFVDFPDILKKYPQFVPYFTDVLNKNNEKIPTEYYDRILVKFGFWLRDANTQEYNLINIIKLFDSQNNSEKKILFEYFKNLRRNSGIFIARTVLEQIGNNLTRGELLELKDYYLRSDSWERRQIVTMILHGLSVSENRPFIKDLDINSSDFFISAIIKEYRKKNKR